MKTTKSENLYYPLTNPQNIQMITETIYTGTPCLNICFSAEFDNPQMDNLEKAIHLVLSSHDAISIRFTVQKGQYLQYIAPYNQSELQRLDFTAEGGDEGYKTWIEKVKITPFEILDSQLYSCFLFHKAFGKGGFLITIHHAIGDGVTLNLLFDQIIDIYKCICSGQIPLIKENPSYIEFIENEKKYVESDEFLRDKEFWQNEFVTLPPQIIMPYNRRKEDDIKATVINCPVQEDIAALIFAFCRKNNVSFYKVLMSALYIYIYRCTDIEDITVGMLSHNRRTQREKETAGMFVNAFPLRLTINETMSFNGFLNSSSEKLNYVLKNHSRYPYNQLASDLRQHFGDGDAPRLMNIILVGENAYYYDDFKIQHHHSGYEPPPFYLMLAAFFDGISCKVTKIDYIYPEGMYSEDDINRIHSHLLSIIKDGLKNPDMPVSELKMLPKDEYEQIMKLNDTFHELPCYETVLDYIHDIKPAFSKNIAVIDGEVQMNYEELLHTVSGVAGNLIAADIKKGNAVAIIADPDIDTVILPLAVISAGAYFIPINASYPEERIHTILEDSRAVAVCCREQYRSLCNNFEGKVLSSEKLLNYQSENEVELTYYKPDGNDIAYCIYTSGSTGKPKGVIIRHKSLLNFSIWYCDIAKLNCEDRVTKYFSFSFDASILDMFPTLIAGAVLVIINSDVRLDVKKLYEYCSAQKITKTFLPPIVGEQFLKYKPYPELELLGCGGDVFKNYQSVPYRVLNLYGPTEGTVVSTCYEVHEDKEVMPIGKAIYNTHIYILDRKDKLQPFGVPGEICISGYGISEGYYNNPALTEARFCEDPFLNGQIMYRTGDKGCMLENGDVIFMGRIDQQIKIHGFRIEPGEVEHAILSFKGITQAIVASMENNQGEKMLCAYFTADNMIDTQALKTWIRRKLPAFMIPGYMRQIEYVPLTVNGKLDRKKLPFDDENNTAYERPLSRREEELLELWKQALNKDRLGCTDDFFACGGHSLTAAALLAQINEKYNFRLGMQSLFDYPTVREFTKHISSINHVEHRMLTAAKNSSFYPAAAAQKRMFTEENMYDMGTAYNTPFFITIEGNISPYDVDNAVEKILEYHESLRTWLDTCDGVVVQRIEPLVVQVSIEKRSILPGELYKNIKACISPIDIGKPGLFRAFLLEETENLKYLVVDVHHAIFDGISVQIFFEEFTALLSGKQLAPTKFQYKDFAVWQEEFLLSQNMYNQEEYWLSMYRDGVPALNLPLDFPRPPVMSYEGRCHAEKLDDNLYSQIKTAARFYKVTPSIIFHVAYVLLMNKYCRQEDIIIGCGSAGRSLTEIQNMIGMFVNTLPIRAQVKDEMTISELVADFKILMSKALDNQDYQFDRLVQQLKIPRDTSKNPLIDSGIVYRKCSIRKVQYDDIAVSISDIFTDTALFDLLLDVFEDENECTLTWVYRNTLFREETVSQMAGHFIKILGEIVKEPDLVVKDIYLLSKEEELKQLVDYNRTEASYPSGETLVSIFEEIAAKFPQRTAIRFQGKGMTYCELNAKVNRLARTLINIGVMRESIVGVLAEPSFEIVIGILAIMKAGGCYLPFNTEYPKERISFMMDNSKAEIMLTSKGYSELCQESGYTLIDLFNEDVYDLQYENPQRVNTPQDLAYIIYTSGSTGKPKGVMIEHHNVVRLFINDRMQYNIGENDVWSLFHSPAFDFSVWEMYGALLFGGTLVVVPANARREPSEFRKLILDEKVTVLSQTPGAFYRLIDEELRHPMSELVLRYVTFGGDKLKPVLLKDWYRKYPEVKLINMYGITETTVHVTYKEITDEEIERNISNIGSPIPTLTTYIMDSEMRLLPMGVPGEICVGGEGVGRGYLGLPQLTSEKFVSNPYKPNERLYRSGDLARLLPAGEMEYLGRIDFQAKIRGFRIELGEIETCLMGYPLIDKAIVTTRDDSAGTKYLCAYYTSKEKINTKELKQHIDRHLPAYMVPSFFVPLDEFPLTVNGKINAALLPDPAALNLNVTALEEPQTETEKYLIDVWKRMLRLEKIGVNDNFFELGGHSLLAVSTAFEIQKCYKISTNEVFEYPTVKEMASHITTKADSFRERIAKLKTLLPKAMEPDKNELQMAVKNYQEYNAKYSYIDMSKSRNYRYVLLAGATGYLGVHILHGLLCESDKQVICIIRSDSDKQAVDRLKEKTTYYFEEGFTEKYSSRLNVYAGDLSRPDAGMSAAKAAEIIKPVDCIINAAANVNHFGRYEEFYSGNVQTVRTLLFWAEKLKNCDVHHMSTLSVCMGDIPGKNHLIFTENDLDLGQNSDNNYVRTKLMAEKEVVEARKRGVNTSIYRLGNISVNSINGKLQQNIETNAFFRQLHSLIRLGAVPTSFDEVEFSFVDRIAEAILKLYERDSLVNEIFHLANTNVSKLSEILPSLNPKYCINTMEFDEFIDFLCRMEENTEKCNYIKEIIQQRGWFAMTDLLQDGSLSRIVPCTVLFDKTRTILEHCGFKWPVTKWENLEQLMYYAAGANNNSNITLQEF